jgi:hypothetical protein
MQALEEGESRTTRVWSRYRLVKENKAVFDHRSACRIREEGHAVVNRGCMRVDISVLDALSMHRVGLYNSNAPLIDAYRLTATTVTIA